MSNNLLEKLNNTDGTKRSSRINTTLFSKINFMSNLSWEFRFNYNRRFDEQHTWPQRGGSRSFQHRNGSPGTHGVGRHESVNTYNFTNYSYTLENLLRYNVTIAKDHEISALAGYQEFYYQSSWLSTEKKGLADEYATIPSGATTLISTEGSKNDNASRSWFGRLNYAYKSRYLFEGTCATTERRNFTRNIAGGCSPCRRCLENHRGELHEMVAQIPGQPEDTGFVRTTWQQCGQRRLRLPVELCLHGGLQPQQCRNKLPSMPPRSPISTWVGNAPTCST